MSKENWGSKLFLFLTAVLAISAAYSAYSAHISATKVHQPIYDVKEMSYYEKNDAKGD